VKIDGNELSTVPPDLINQSDSRNLLRYLSDFYDNNLITWNQVKLMIVGKEGKWQRLLGYLSLNCSLRCRKDESGSLAKAQSSGRDHAQRSTGTKQNSKRAIHDIPISLSLFLFSTNGLI
jgi:hypothetical protein